MAGGETPIRRRGARGAGAKAPSDPLRNASRPGAMRLQRLLADAGVASRRRCEEMIEAGEVRVNGRVVDSLPAFATPADRVEVRGLPIALEGTGRASGAKGDLRHSKRRTGDGQAQRLLYVMLYKPRAVVSAASDPAGRRTVVDLVQHPSGARLFPVGRLDFETQGLLLLTNDGELTNRLTHPRFGVHKTYRALVKGLLDEPAARELEQGIYLAERKEGKTVGAKRTSHVGITIVKRDRDRTVLDITLQEGRNRQVRRMLAKVGCPVKRLVRTRIGPLSLRGLAVGQWRELTRDELRAIRAAAAGEPASPTGAPEAGPSVGDGAPAPAPRRERPRRPPSRGPGAGQRRSRPASDGRDAGSGRSRPARAGRPGTKGRPSGGPGGRKPPRGGAGRSTKRR